MSRTEWRENRDDRWYRDVGYELESILKQHRYLTQYKGSKPDDPGWHECSCGKWQGYWSSFNSHVADHLRDLVVPHMETPLIPKP